MRIMSPPPAAAAAAGAASAGSPVELWLPLLLLLFARLSLLGPPLVSDASESVALAPLCAAAPRPARDASEDGLSTSASKYLPIVFVRIDSKCGAVAAAAPAGEAAAALPGDACEAGEDAALLLLAVAASGRLNRRTVGSWGRLLPPAPLAPLALLPSAFWPSRPWSSSYPPSSSRPVQSHRHSKH